MPSVLSTQEAEAECNGVNCQLDRIWNHLVMSEGDYLQYISRCAKSYLQMRPLPGQGSYYRKCTQQVEYKLAFLLLFLFRMQCDQALQAPTVLTFPPWQTILQMWAETNAFSLKYSLSGHFITGTGKETKTQEGCVFRAGLGYTETWPQK